MPKLNYGFKGDVITAADAINAGAPTTADAYQYAVQGSAITPLTAPGVIRNVEVVPEDTLILLSWDAPLDPGSSPVVGYEILYFSDTTPEQTVFSGFAGCILSELTNGTPYTVVVTAVNEAVGAGTPVAVVATPHPSTIVTADGFDLLTETGDLLLLPTDELLFTPTFYFIATETNDLISQ